MATGGPLTGQRKCSVCRSWRDHPQVLKECNHIICPMCIQRLARNEKIICVKCYKVNKISDIRGYFETTSFKEVHRNENVIFSTATINNENLIDNTFPNCPAICGICDKVVIKCYCTDCQHYLCEKCASMHSRLKLSKTHSVRSDLFELMAKSVHEPLDELKKLVIELQHEKDYISKMITKIESEIGKPNSLFRYLGNDKKICEEAKEEIHNKIGFLTEVIKIHKIKNEISTIIRHVKDSVLKLKSRLPSVEFDSNVNPQNIIPEVDNDAPVGTNQPVTPLFNFLDMCQQEFHHALKTRLEFYPFKLAIVNNQVWCGGNSVLCSMNEKCEVVDSISGRNLSSIRGFTQAYTGDIFVTCGYEKGLHLLDQGGHYKRQISEGSFSDICSYNKKVYALRYKKCDVLVLEYIINEWTHSQTILLDYGRPSPYDNICINSTHIYVSISYRKCIYVYDTTGNKVNEIRKGDRDMYVCRIDHAGNLLVIAEDIKVYDCREKWHKFPVRVYAKNDLMDSMIDYNGNLWTVDFSARKVYLYQKKE